LERIFIYGLIPLGLRRGFMASQAIGSYAFLIGFALAIILGVVGVLMPNAIAGFSGVLMLIVIILGLVVGLLNIKDKHVTDFLIATIAVTMVGSTAGGLVILNEVIPPLGTLMAAIVLNIVALAAPAALVVGLKQIWLLAKEQA